MIINNYLRQNLNNNIDFSYLVKKAKDLQPKSDLNNITASGIYYLDSTPEWLNVPISNVTNCYLIVFALNAKRCTQIILPGNAEYIYIIVLPLQTNNCGKNGNKLEL